MAYTIRQWAEIKERYTDTILLGNGASIAVNQTFQYNSLLEQACSQQLLSPAVNQLFQYFQTCDFELILRIVWHASIVNKALGIFDEATENAYTEIRENLIHIIRNIHPDYSALSSNFENMYSFLKSFKTVISLNYDLLVYWMMMYGSDINDQHSFKDCFVNGRFFEDWRRLYHPINYDKSCTLVFYPHGHLALVRSIYGEENKLSTSTGGLLGSISNAWQQGQCIPLFVSEGSERQKITSINNSHYLSRVYYEVLPAIKPDITVYGWRFGEQDLHLLRSMQNSQIRSVAVSVYGNDDGYCDNVYRIIKSILGQNVNVDFFDCLSRGCWIY